MKLKDLNLEQKVTVFNYRFDLNNDIVISELNYYVHKIVTEDAKIKGVILHSLEQYPTPYSLNMESKDGNEFKQGSNNSGYIELYSLNNNEETLNQFKFRAIKVLKHQTEYFKEQEEMMHQMYLDRFERLNKLISSYNNKDKSE
jgi:pyruvate/2-oxoacid:ferredoxin oxidoreductase beta subunit